MRKLLLISVVCFLVVAGAAPALSNDEPREFVMTGADAAYAQFEKDGCSLFVGYVYADRLKYFGERGGPARHSDVEVNLTGTCGGVSTPLRVVVPSLDHDDAEMVTLESATLASFSVGDAVVDLAWTAIGDTYTEVYREPGMRAAHRTRDAALSGTVTIGSLQFDASTNLDPTWRDPFITHYNTIVRNNLP